MPDYSDIPTTGQHRGPRQANDTGTEVRAEQPGPTDPEETTYRLVHSTEQGQYRLSRWTEDARLDEGYREIGRYRESELPTALARLPDGPRFVVFENSETGEVHMQRESEISSNWTDGGRFDRVILFDEESEAATYVASRQG